MHACRARNRRVEPWTACDTLRTSTELSIFRRCIKYPWQLCSRMLLLFCPDGFDRTHRLSPLQQGVHSAGTPPDGARLFHSPTGNRLAVVSEAVRRIILKVTHLAVLNTQSSRSRRAPQNRHGGRTDRSSERIRVRPSAGRFQAWGSWPETEVFYYCILNAVLTVPLAARSRKSQLEDDRKHGVAASFRRGRRAR